MARLWLGLVLGMAMMAPWAQAFRIPAPSTVSEWNESSIAQLNVTLRSLWQLTNGRYTTDVTTTNPNGSLDGTQGDTVFYNNSGSYKQCVNTTATTPTSPTGKTWRCSANAFTAP